MLLSESDGEAWPDYGGEEFSGFGKSSGAARSRTSVVPFLGIRYALVCWLDELFLVDSFWDTRWNENKLELALWDPNNHAGASSGAGAVAETRPGTESLSAFFLCVMLGFRGEMSEHADQLQGWIENCRRWLRPAAKACTGPGLPN